MNVSASNFYDPRGLVKHPLRIPNPPLPQAQKHPATQLASKAQPVVERGPVSVPVVFLPDLHSFVEYVDAFSRRDVISGCRLLPQLRRDSVRRDYAQAPCDVGQSRHFGVESSTRCRRISDGHSTADASLRDRGKCSGMITFLTEPAAKLRSIRHGNQHSLFQPFFENRPYEDRQRFANALRNVLDLVDFIA